MRITLAKFGTTLTSRQAGSEAFKALQPLLRDVQSGERLEIDFEGVHTLTPSWADEFLTPLIRQFEKELTMLPSDNLSVQATMRLLGEIHKDWLPDLDSNQEPSR